VENTFDEKDSKQLTIHPSILSALLREKGPE
jgi:hypothetical protein